ncbi:hypothetical protein INR49_004809 [Caranx melampygus]|nr:hypothetical protein INR49_004809 [Caranx melampygus]
MSSCQSVAWSCVVHCCKAQAGHTHRLPHRSELYGAFDAVKLPTLQNDNSASVSELLTAPTRSWEAVDVRLGH